MAKNQFSPQQDLPDENELKKLITNFNYRRLEIADLPPEIATNGLTTKCNSFILGASGSTSGMLYSFVGIRPDGNDIDENPFVYYYDYTDANKNFGGIIHHGDWQLRTVPMSSEQMNAMAASGLTASFTYKGIPTGASGSLNDLKSNGMLDGFSDQFEILFRNKDK